MFARVLLVVLAFCVVPLPAEARRVALVIGQDAYPGGASAAIGLPRLDNPALDARRMAELLAKHGFEVVRCDGKAPGCFNLDRSRFLDVLKTFEQRATGADMALVFYAGHGMGTDEGNILAPIDAKVSCATGAISHGIPVERIMAATRPAKHKLLILDACRNNPLGEVCPNLKNKKRAFTRIEAGAFQGLLLVTSTQFGQEALDGPPGIHSPFAKALFAALEENPNIYFEQAFNQVARATYDAAQKHDAFLQIPGRVVGGEAPADCLAGKACVGDLRMAAMAVENERLTADAAGVRNIIDQEQLTRGSPYTMEERKARVAELERTLASIATSGDPLRQEARRLIDGGNVASGKAKLDEALDADEKALEEAQRVVQEKRQAAAQSARDLAVLTKGTDVVSAVAYYGRATRLDPNNLSTWHEYSRAAQEAGRTSEAKTALEQLAIKAQEAKNTYWQLWSVISLGELVEKHGSLDKARELYEQAFNIWESRGSEPRDGAIVLAKLGHIFRDQGNLALALTKHQQALELIKELATRYPYDTGYQKDLSDSYADIGSVLSRQGNLTGALDQHGTALAIAERLAQNDPANLGWQRLIQAAHEQIGTVLVDQGELAKALESFRASLAIANRLAKADPGNAFSLKALHGAYDDVGDVFREQGDYAAAIDSFQSALAIVEKLAEADPSNTGWQLDLAISLARLGEVSLDQGNTLRAVSEFQKAHAIFGRLGQSDPANVGWQSNLATSHAKLALAQRKNGELRDALDNAKDYLGTAERRLQLDPGNIVWQGHVATGLELAGEILVEMKNAPEAFERYTAALAIRERLATTEYGSSNVAQRYLADLHGRLAVLLAQRQQREQALSNLRRGRDIIVDLQGRPALQLSAKVMADLKSREWFEQQIAELEKK